MFRREDVSLSSKMSIKKKSRLAGTFFEFSLSLSNNTSPLKSRSGTKKVIKVKECVVSFHFCLDTSKIKLIFLDLQGSL